MKTILALIIGLALTGTAFAQSPPPPNGNATVACPVGIVNLMLTGTITLVSSGDPCKMMIGPGAAGVQVTVQTDQSVILENAGTTWQTFTWNGTVWSTP
jgi:hypothetical protein